MKLFIEASALNKNFQGTYTYVYEIIRSLNKKYGHNLELIIGVLCKKDIPSSIKNRPNIKIVEYKSRFKFYRFTIEIPLLLKKYRIKNALFQYFIPLLNFNKCNYFVVIHDVLFLDFKFLFSKSYSFFRYLIFGFSARCSAKIFTVSSYSKKRITQHFKVESNKVYITPNGISEEFKSFSYSKDESKEFILNKFNLSDYCLFVSRFEVRKNHKILIKNISKLPSKNLVFIGSSRNISKEINYMIDSNDNIYAFENVAFTDLLHFYNASELFLYPSLAEGFGIPPLEAGVLCTPVVCASNTALSDFKELSFCMFDLKSEQSFLNSLTSFVKDKKELEKTKIMIINKYNWVNTSDIIFDNIL
tara:strand:+ start:1743 stop:2822 length:1080 start_codon:yes stop_codon:yes gene_type:complete